MGGENLSWDDPTTEDKIKLSPVYCSSGPVPDGLDTGIDRNPGVPTPPTAATQGDPVSTSTTRTPRPARQAPNRVTKLRRLLPAVETPAEAKARTLKLHSEAQRLADEKVITRHSKAKEGMTGCLQLAIPTQVPVAPSPAAQALAEAHASIQKYQNEALGSYEQGLSLTDKAAGANTPQLQGSFKSLLEKAKANIQKYQNMVVEANRITLGLRDPVAPNHVALVLDQPATVSQAANSGTNSRPSAPATQASDAGEQDS